MSLRRVASGLALALLLSAPLAAQRSDSYTWKLGINVGGLAFQTHDQDTKVVPAAGAHVLIMARRGGLQFGVDEGIGTNEVASSAILFNDVRRYSAMLMAFPVSGPVEPYFGGGGGLVQVVNPRVNRDVISDPTEQQQALVDAKDHSSSGYVGFIAGVQGRWKRFTVFAQYEVGTAPGSDNLLQGATQTLLGGLRIGLGSAREGVTAGGY